MIPVERRIIRAAVLSSRCGAGARLKPPACGQIKRRASYRAVRCRQRRRRCSSQTPLPLAAVASVGDESPRDKPRLGESCTGNTVLSASFRATLFRVTELPQWDDSLRGTPPATPAAAKSTEYFRRDRHFDLRSSSWHESKADGKTFAPPTRREDSRHRD